MKLTQDNSSVVGFRLANEDIEALDEIARRQDRKRSYIMRRYVLRGIDSDIGTKAHERKTDAAVLADVRDKIEEYYFGKGR